MPFVVSFAVLAFELFFATPFLTPPLTTALFEVRTDEEARGFALAPFFAGGGDVFALADVAIVRDFDAIFVPGVFIVRES